MEIPAGISRYRLSSHAARSMRGREIDVKEVEEVMRSPQQRIVLSSQRDVLQSKVGPANRVRLLRIIVDFETDPPAIVSVYKTGKINKYWRPRS